MDNLADAESLTEADKEKEEEKEKAKALRRSASKSPVDEEKKLPVSQKVSRSRTSFYFIIFISLIFWFPKIDLLLIGGESFYTTFLRKIALITHFF